MKTKIFILFFIGAVIYSCQSKLSLQERSTKELFEASVNHPGNPIFFQNCMSTGISVFGDQCPEFKEFWSRCDAASVLLNEYLEFDPLAIDPNWSDKQIGEFSFRAIYIEIFLVQKINELGEADLRILKGITISNYQKKKMLPEVHGKGLSSTGALCASIIYRVNPELFGDHIFEVSRFICTLMSFKGSQILDGQDDPFGFIIELLKSIEL